MVAIDMSDRTLQIGDRVLIPARIVDINDKEKFWFNLKLETTSSLFTATSVALNSKQVYLDARAEQQ